MKMLLNVLPSVFLLARDADRSGRDESCQNQVAPENIVAEIEADFGLSAPQSDPFKEIEDSLNNSILLDPFDFAVSGTFGTSSSERSFRYEHDPHDDALFEGWYDSMDDRVDDAIDLSVKRKRRPNLYPYQFGDVFSAN